jgi:hypothetical protein
MNWKMLTKAKINSFAFIFLLFLISCSKKKEENFIARVGDTYLTKAMLDKALVTSHNSHKFKEEYIREWIRKQLLILDADKKGIFNSDNYKKLIAKAKTDIANALVIEKIINENPVKITRKALEDYFVNNVDEFLLTSQSCIFNKAVFNNYSDAKAFHKSVVKNGWDYAVKNFNRAKLLAFYNTNKYESVYNILPDNLRNEIISLKKDGVSRVIKTSETSFVVVQLKKIYNKNDVPEFEEIKDEIKRKYMAVKRKEIYKNYIKSLYSEYKTEIER